MQPLQTNLFDVSADRHATLAKVPTHQAGELVEELDIENRRYTGSKAKLVNWITQIIEAECEGDSFLDLFAGTGIIAKAAASMFDSIVVNDILYSNLAAYKAFFEPGKVNSEKLAKYIEKYNLLDRENLRKNYFSQNYGGKYFHEYDARLIGYIRNDLEKERHHLTEKEYYVLLVSLLYSIDRVANTVGHYDAFFKIPPKRQQLSMRLIRSHSIPGVKIFRKDANNLVKKIEADVVYIDPPYNSRQYSRFYHVLENLVKWDKPKLYGIALKPKPENISDYCKVKAKDVFAQLIRDLKCKYIVVSYNNTYNSKSSSSRNKISLEQIRDILQKKGKTRTFDIKHKFFNAGNTDFSDHREYLFVCKVKT